MMMDNNSLASSPRTPPTGWIVRITIAVVVVVTLVTMFVFCIMWVQKTGREPGEKPASSVTGSTEDAEKRHLQHVKRVGLQELKHRISMIQSDIDEFESEARDFTKRIEELRVSTQGAPLQHLAPVVDYFSTRWRKALPRVEYAAAYRDQLREYVITAEETLRTKDDAFQLPQETFDDVDYIGWKVASSAQLYHSHNQLLAALSRRIGEGAKADPNTIQDAVLKQEDELILQKLRDIPVSKLENITPITLLPGNEASGLRSRSDPVPGSEEDLYQQERRKQKAETQSGGSSQPLMRDTVPNRPRDE